MTKVIQQEFNHITTVNLTYQVPDDKFEAFSVLLGKIKKLLEN